MKEKRETGIQKDVKWHNEREEREIEMQKDIERHRNKHIKLYVETKRERQTDTKT